MLGLVVFLAAGGVVWSTPTAQPLPPLADSIVVLDEGWRMRAGDDASWAVREDEPDSWIQIDASLAEGRRCPPLAWYHLHLDVPPSMVGEAIEFVPVYVGAIEVFIDGRRVFGRGSVEAAAKGEADIPFQHYTVDAVRHTFRAPGVHLIAVRHGARWTDFLGWLGLGAGFQLKVGRPDAVSDEIREHAERGLTLLWFSGVSITVATLHFFLFCFRRQSREYLYFAITSFGLGAIALSNRMSYEMADLKMTLLFFTVFKLSLIWVSYSFYRFILSLCGGGGRRTSIYRALSIIASVFVFVLPGLAIYLLSSVLVIESALLLLAAIRCGAPGAVGVAVGGGLGCLGAALQMFPALFGYRDDGALFYLYGFCGTYVVVSWLLARNYAKAHEDLSYQMDRALSQERRAQEEALARRGLEAENERKELELEEARKREAMLAELEQAYRELRSTQAQLVQSGKMAALGQLVAGVAHEINTPVGAIASMHHSSSLALERIEAALREDPSLHHRRDEVDKSLGVLREAASVIGTGSDRVGKIVRRLRTFARLDEAEFQRADVNEGIRDTLMLIQHKTKSGIELVCRLDDELPLMPCFPSQLNQVFLNLLVNAVQAIDPPGQVTVTTRASGADVCIRVEDTGRGIPPENLSKIFDPGFTTKGVRVGTGLGLSISYQIIADHQGRIEVKSEEGQGSRFEIWLPGDLDQRLGRAPAA